MPVHRALPISDDSIWLRSKGWRNDSQTTYLLHCKLGNHILTPLYYGRVGVPQALTGIALVLSSSASARVTGAHILLDGYSIKGHDSPDHVPYKDKNSYKNIAV